MGCSRWYMVRLRTALHISPSFFAFLPPRYSRWTYTTILQKRQPHEQCTIGDATGDSGLLCAAEKPLPTPLLYLITSILYTCCMVVQRIVFTGGDCLSLPVDFRYKHRYMLPLWEQMTLPREQVHADKEQKNTQERARRIG